MSEYTEGPWKLVNSDERLGEHQDNYYFIDAGFGFHDPRVNPGKGFGIQSFVNKADAHLIAAAPDMYEALKLMEPLLACFSDADFQYSVNEARLAITKAEGKDNE